MRLLKGAFAAGLSLAVAVGVVGCGSDQTDDGGQPDHPGTGGAPSTGGVDAGPDGATSDGASDGAVDTGAGGTAPTSVCGNHVTEPGEDCDDGNGNNDDGCTS